VENWDVAALKAVTGGGDGLTSPHLPKKSDVVKYVYFSATVVQKMLNPRIINMKKKTK
jgi:hypothetical protein